MKDNKFKMIEACFRMKLAQRLYFLGTSINFLLRAIVTGKTFTGLLKNAKRMIFDWMNRSLIDLQIHPLGKKLSSKLAIRQSVAMIFNDCFISMILTRVKTSH